MARILLKSDKGVRNSTTKNLKYKARESRPRGQKQVWGAISEWKGMAIRMEEQQKDRRNHNGHG